MGEREDEKTRIEMEARRAHGYSLADVIGASGGGLMSGASPVPRPQQVAAQIEVFLDAHLGDVTGTLRRVFVRTFLADPVFLEQHFDAPLDALAAVVERVLASQDLLVELVRATDAEWGREMDERPMFQQPGEPPRPGDPYTHESVREQLRAVLAAIRA